MGGARARLFARFRGFTDVVCVRRLGGPVLDLLYIGLTIVVFGALYLLVRGVERVER